MEYIIVLHGCLKEYITFAVLQVFIQFAHIHSQTYYMITEVKGSLITVLPHFQDININNKLCPSTPIIQCYSTYPLQNDRVSY